MASAIDSFETVESLELSNTEGQAEAEECVSPEQKRRRGKAKEWIMVKMFDCAADFDEWFQPTGEYSRNYCRNVLDGEKVYFRCKYARKRGWTDCPNELCVLYCAEDHRVRVEQHGIHIHERTKSSGAVVIEGATKDVIVRGIQDHLTASQIMRKLHDNSLALPGKMQLNNFMQYFKKKLEPKPIVTTADLRNWAQQNCSIPDTDDSAFVISFDVQDASAPVTFNVVISSKRLLSLLIDNPFLQTDATYKIVWQGFPLLMCGTSDKDHKLFLVAISFASHETATAFAFLFRALKKSISDIYSEDFIPEVIMADGAEAITSAVTDVFPYSDRAMCWAHVSINLDKKLLSIQNEQLRSIVRTEIHVLQLASDNNEFHSVFALLIAKWKSSSDPDLLHFAIGFQKDWIDSSINGWYEGFSPHPSTNNGLERTNLTIKDNHTFRNRLSIQLFFGVAVEMVESWSRNVEREPMCTERTIRLSEWTQACQWLQQKPSILRLKSPQAAYVTRASNCMSDLRSIAHDYVNSRMQGFASWGDFERLRGQLRYLQADGSGFQCSCAAGSKRGNCKHALGLAMKLNIVQPPKEATAIPLGCRRKRGRPKKAKSALKRN